MPHQPPPAGDEQRPEPPDSHSPFEDHPPAPPLRVVVADDNPVVRAGLTALLSGRPDITVVAEAADGREAYEAARAHRPDVTLLDVRMPGVDGISALPHLVRIAPVVMLTYSREPEIVEEALRRGADGYLVHGEFTADELVAAVRDIRLGKSHFTPTAAGTLLARLRHTRRQDTEPLPEGLGEAGEPVEGASAHAETASTPVFQWDSPKPLSRMQSHVGQLKPDRTSGASAAAPGGSRSQLSAREAEIMDLIASGMNNQQIAAACFISEKTVKNHINRIFSKLHSSTRAQATAKWLGTAPTSRRGLG